jgi:outer membrane protein OmpA-like peptidoglycan-associated protein
MAIGAVKTVVLAVSVLALPPTLQADCPSAGKIVDQAFALNVRERIPLLESAAEQCPTFGIIEALGESYQARADWDTAERTYALANGHVTLAPQAEREHQQAILLYRSAQIALGRHQLCRAVAQYAEAARRFSGPEQDQARAEMLKAEAEWTDRSLSAADINCALSTQIRAYKDYCDGGQCRLYHDAAVDIPVQFANDSAELAAAAKQQVSEIAAGAGPFVQQGYGLRVTGHTDKRGTREYNYKLSRERAHSVAVALAASLHVSPEDIKTDGKGFDELKYQGDTPEVNRLNRRVEVALRPPSGSTNAGSP